MKAQLPLGLVVIATYEIIVGSLGMVLSAVLFVTNAPLWSAITASFILL